MVMAACGITLTFLVTAIAATDAGDRLELHLERSDDRVTFTIEGPDAERYTQGALLVK